MPAKVGLVYHSFIEDVHLGFSNIISFLPKKAELKSKVEVGTVIFARCAEAIVSSTLNLATFSVLIHSWKHLIQSTIITILENPSKMSLEDVTGEMIADACRVLELMFKLGGTTLAVFAVAGYLDIRIEAGRVKVEKLVGFKARKIADNIINNLPPTRKKLSQASLIGANFAGFGLVFNSAFKLNLVKESIVFGVVAGIANYTRLLA